MPVLCQLSNIVVSITNREINRAPKPHKRFPPLICPLTDAVTAEELTPEVTLEEVGDDEVAEEEEEEAEVEVEVEDKVLLDEVAVDVDLLVVVDAELEIEVVP